MLPNAWLYAAGGALTIFGLTVTLRAVRLDRPRDAYWAKPLASAGFLVAALGAGALHSRVGGLILGALVLSAVGDVFLLGRARGWFLGGLVAFLLGHVAYVAAFVDRGLHGATSLATAAAGLVAAGVVLRWLWPHLPGRMRGPVVAYVLVITAMVVTAAGTTAARGRPEIAAAALVFYASDLSVARDRFLGAGFNNRLWGLSAYYLGQLVFAFAARPP